MFEQKTYAFTIAHRNRTDRRRSLGHRLPIMLRRVYLFCKVHVHRHAAGAVSRTKGIS